ATCAASVVATREPWRRDCDASEDARTPGVARHARAVSAVQLLDMQAPGRSALVRRGDFRGGARGGTVCGSPEGDAAPEGTRMGQRTSTESIVAIVQAFLAQRTWRQAELARHVGVQTPALRRRLNELARLGFPLTSDEE